MKRNVARKIDLENLLDILYNLYEEGACFVDIVTLPSREGDKLAIRTSQEYYTDDLKLENPMKLTTPEEPDFSDLDNLITL